MAFFEELFPECYSAEMTGGPRFLTSKAYMLGGQRITNRDAQLPLHEWQIAQPPQSQEAFDEIRSFFYVVGGDADAFRVKDWSDFECSADRSSMTLVTAGQYQMNKRYVYGSRTFTRPIQKPVAGAQIFRTRSGVTTEITSTDASVNTTTGIVTIANHVSGDVYTWSGEFHVPAAFKDPAAVFRIVSIGPSILSEWPGIALEEVRI